MQLVISAVIWDELLQSGKSQCDLLPVAEKFGCAGIEFRPYWRSVGQEIPSIETALTKHHLIATYACNEGLLAETEEATRQAIRAMADSLDLAARLRAKVLRINVAGGAFDQAMAETTWWLRLVRQLAASAGEQGIMLAIENPSSLPGGDPLFIRELLARVESPWLRATFDTGNWLPAGWSPEQALEILAGYIGYVHLKDMVLRPEGYVSAYLGGGSVDLAGLIGRLKQLSYQGLWVLEFSGAQNPAALVKASLEFLRQENG